MKTIEERAEDYIMSVMEDWPGEVVPDIQQRGKVGRFLISIESQGLVDIARAAFREGFKQGEQSFYDKQPAEPMARHEVDSIVQKVTGND